MHACTHSLNNHKYTMERIHLSLHNYHTHTHTPSCHHPSQPFPPCPVLARGQQVSHREATRLTLSCWQRTRLSLVRSLIQARARTQKVTHIQRLACLSFLTGWQRATGFTPTQLCYRLAFSSINLCRRKHKPTGIQYGRRAKKRRESIVILVHKCIHFIRNVLFITWCNTNLSTHPTLVHLLSYNSHTVLYRRASELDSINYTTDRLCRFLCNDLGCFQMSQSPPTYQILYLSGRSWRKITCTYTVGSTRSAHTVHLFRGDVVGVWAFLWKY